MPEVAVPPMDSDRAAEVLRSVLRRGDEVTFRHKGAVLRGTILKCQRKTCGVDTGAGSRDRKQRQNVSYFTITHVRSRSSIPASVWEARPA